MPSAAQIKVSANRASTGIERQIHRTLRALQLQLAVDYLEAVLDYHLKGPARRQEFFDPARADQMMPSF